MSENWQDQGVATDRFQPVAPLTRALLGVIAVLVFLAGIQLFVLSDATDRYFAWTIRPPLTAAFLGAGFWASLVAVGIALRGRHWASVRSTAPVVMTATTVLLLATLMHLDRFHFSSPDLLPWLAAWAWLIVYVVVPPVFLLTWYRQVQTPGDTPPEHSPLPAWLRTALAVAAIVGIGTGIALFVLPASVAAWWPWAITELTGQAIAAWVLAIGVASAAILRENDLDRSRVALAALAAFAVLQLVALARFSSDVDFGRPAAWVYIAFLVLLALAAVVGLARAARPIRLGRVATDGTRVPLPD